MKWIFVWFGLASLVVAAAASSCSINHRSGQYDCATAADCDPGRTCSEGLCVLGGGGGGDGGGPLDGGVLDARKDAPPPDAALCPSQCTSCGPNKTCVIDCAAGANCGPQVVCPAGFNCDIRCNTDASCRQGVNCTSAASCTLQCTGRSSCRGVQCGPGACDVSCSGYNTCESVLCGTSCACDVKCGLASSCLTVQCTRAECDTGRGCSSTVRPICDICP
jgi:hypothetical protein